MAFYDDDEDRRLNTYDDVFDKYVDPELLEPPKEDEGFFEGSAFKNLIQRPIAKTKESARNLWRSFSWGNASEDLAVSAQSLVRAEELLRAEQGEDPEAPAPKPEAPAEPEVLDFEELKKQILKDEGDTNKVYRLSYTKADGTKVTEPFLTAGVGHKITPEDEAKYGPFIEGQKLPKDLKEKWLEEDLASAMEAARRSTPNFDELPAKAQQILTEMAFQMGGQGLAGFKKMHAALAAGDFETASKEMLDSAWANQTPGRAQRKAREMASLSMPTSSPVEEEGAGPFRGLLDTLASVGRGGFGTREEVATLGTLDELERNAEIARGAENIRARLASGETADAVAADLIARSDEHMKGVRNSLWKSISRNPESARAMVQLMNTPGLTMDDVAGFAQEPWFRGMTDLMAESLAPSLAIGAAGLVGGTAGAVVGRNPQAARAAAAFASGIASATVEQKLAVMEYMMDEGVNIFDTAEVFDFMRKEYETYTDIERKASTRGGFVGLFDGLSVGGGGLVGGAVMTPARVAALKSRVAAKAMWLYTKATAAELGAQATAGALGAWTGQVAATGDMSLDEPFLEFIGDGLAGGPTSAATGIAVGRLGSRVERMRAEGATEEQILEVIEESGVAGKSPEQAQEPELPRGNPVTGLADPERTVKPSDVTAGVDEEAVDKGRQIIEDAKKRKAKRAEEKAVAKISPEVEVTQQTEGPTARDATARLEEALALDTAAQQPVEEEGPVQGPATYEEALESETAELTRMFGAPASARRLAEARLAGQGVREETVPEARPDTADEVPVADEAALTEEATSIDTAEPAAPDDDVTIARRLLKEEINDQFPEDGVLASVLAANGEDVPQDASRTTLIEIATQRALRNMTPEQVSGLANEYRADVDAVTESVEAAEPDAVPLEEAEADTTGATPAAAVPDMESLEDIEASLQEPVADDGVPQSAIQETVEKAQADTERRRADAVRQARTQARRKAAAKVQTKIDEVLAGDVRGEPVQEDPNIVPEKTPAQVQAELANNEEMLARLNAARNKPLRRKSDGGTREKSEWVFEQVLEDGRVVLVERKDDPDSWLAVTIDPITGRSEYYDKGPTRSLSANVRKNLETRGIWAYPAVAEEVAKILRAEIETRNQEAKGVITKRLPVAQSTEATAEQRRKEAAEGKFEPLRPAEFPPEPRTVTAVDTSGDVAQRTTQTITPSFGVRRKGRDAQGNYTVPLSERVPIEEFLADLQAAQGETRGIYQEVAGEENFVPADELVPPRAGEENVNVETYMTPEDKQAITSGQQPRAIAVQILPDGSTRVLEIRVNPNRDQYDISIVQAAPRAADLSDSGLRWLEIPEDLGSIPIEKGRAAQLRARLASGERTTEGVIDRILTPFRDRGPARGAAARAQEQAETTTSLLRRNTARLNSLKDLKEALENNGPMDEQQERAADVFGNNPALVQESIDRTQERVRELAERLNQEKQAAAEMAALTSAGSGTKQRKAATERAVRVLKKANEDIDAFDKEYLEELKSLSSIPQEQRTEEQSARVRELARQRNVLAARLASAAQNERAASSTVRKVKDPDTVELRIKDEFLPEGFIDEQLESFTQADTEAGYKDLGWATVTSDGALFVNPDNFGLVALRLGNAAVQNTRATTEDSPLVWSTSEGRGGGGGFVRARDSRQEEIYTDDKGRRLTRINDRFRLQTPTEVARRMGEIVQAAAGAVISNPNSQEAITAFVRLLGKVGNVDSARRFLTNQQLPTIAQALGVKVNKNDSFAVMFDKMAERINEVIKGNRDTWAEAYSLMETNSVTVGEFLAEKAGYPNEIDVENVEEAGLSVNPNTEAGFAAAVRLRKALMARGFSPRAIRNTLRGMVRRENLKAEAERFWNTALSFEVEESQTVEEDMQTMEEEKTIEEIINNSATEESMMAAALREAANKASAPINQAQRFALGFARTPNFLRPQRETAEQRAARMRERRTENRRAALEAQGEDTSEEALLDAQLRTELRPTLGLPEGVPAREDDLETRIRNFQRRRARERRASAASQRLDESAAEIAEDEALEVAEAAAKKPVESSRDLTAEEEAELVDDELANANSDLKDDDATKAKDNKILDIDPGLVSGFGVVDPTVVLRNVAKKVGRFLIPTGVRQWYQDKQTMRDIYPVLREIVVRGRGLANFNALEFFGASVKLEQAMQDSGLADGATSVERAENRDRLNRAVTLYIENRGNLAAVRRKYGVDLPQPILDAVAELQAMKLGLSMEVAAIEVIPSKVKNAIKKRGSTYLHKQLAVDRSVLDQVLGRPGGVSLKSLSSDERRGLIQAAIAQMEYETDPDVIMSMTRAQLKAMLGPFGVFGRYVKKNPVGKNQDLAKSIPTSFDDEGNPTEFKTLQKATREEILQFVLNTVQRDDFQADKDQIFRDQLEHNLNTAARRENRSDDQVTASGDIGDRNIIKSRQLLLSERDQVRKLLRVLADTPGKDSAAFRKEIRALIEREEEIIKSYEGTGQEPDPSDGLLEDEGVDFVIDLIEQNAQNFGMTPAAERQIELAKRSLEMDKRLRKALREITDPVSLMSDTGRRMGDVLAFDAIMNSLLTAGERTGMVSSGPKEGFVRMAEVENWLARLTRNREKRLGTVQTVAPLEEGSVRLPSDITTVEDPVTGEDVRVGGFTGIGDIYVHPDFRNAVHDLLGIKTYVNDGGLVRALRLLSGAAKLDKVVLNPLGHPRNYVSTGFLGLTRGMVTFSRTPEGVMGAGRAAHKLGGIELKGTFGLSGRLASEQALDPTNDAFMANLRKAVTTRGVNHDAVKAGAVVDLFAHLQQQDPTDQLAILSGNTWLAGSGGLARNQLQNVRTAFGTGVKNTTNFAMEAFRLEDEMMKVAGFLTRSGEFLGMMVDTDSVFGDSEASRIIQTHLENPNAYSPDQRALIERAMDMAAANVLDTMPTFSRAPAFIRALSRNFFFGAFPTFHAEMVRNTANQIKFISDLWKGEFRGTALDRNKSRSLARSLVLKQAFATGAMTVGLGLTNAIALAALSRKGTDAEDDQELRDILTRALDLRNARNAKQFRNLLPDWYGDSQLVILKFGDGKFYAADLGFIAPSGALQEMVWGITNDIAEVWERPDISRQAKDRIASHIAESALFRLSAVFANEEVFAGDWADFWDERPGQGVREGSLLVKTLANAVNQNVRDVLSADNEDPSVTGRALGATLGAATANFPGTTATNVTQRAGKAVIEALEGDRTWMNLAATLGSNVTGIRMVQFDVNETYPGTFKYQDAPTLRQANGAIMSLFDPAVPMTREDFAAEYEALEEIRKDTFERVHTNFRTMRQLGASEDQIRKAVEEGNGGSFKQAGSFTFDQLMGYEDYTPRMVKEGDMRDLIEEGADTDELRQRLEWYYELAGPELSR